MKITEEHTCLVTGGAGFIGSHLVDCLLDRGCKVVVLDSLASGSLDNLDQLGENSRLSFIEGSILDVDTVRTAVSKADVVFHLACLGVRHSLVNPLENHAVNALGTLLLLEESLRKPVKRFLYCSSSEVYGTATFVPMSEQHPTFPCTVYGGAKLAGEAYARAYFTTFGLPTTIVRPFNTYGPRSHHERELGEFIPKSIVRALAGMPILIFGDGTITRDFTFVTDMVKAIADAAEEDSCLGLTHNIGSNSEISLKDLGKDILRLVGNSASYLQHGEPRPGDVLRLFADSSLAQSKGICVAGTPFESGLQQTVEFFRSHPRGLPALVAEEGGRTWEQSSRFR